MLNGGAQMDGGGGSKGKKTRQAQPDLGSAYADANADTDTRLILCA